MTTRCKFKCDSVLLTKDGSEVTLTPVTCGSLENDEFFKWTPYGSLKIGLIKLSRTTDFVPGEEYYIDIISVKEIKTEE